MERSPSFVSSTKLKFKKKRSKNKYMQTSMISISLYYLHNYNKIPVIILIKIRCSKIDTSPRRGHTEGSETYERMLGITSHQRDAN